jgi:hypothetical protein
MGARGLKGWEKVEMPNWVAACLEQSAMHWRCRVDVAMIKVLFDGIMHL